FMPLTDLFFYYVPLYNKFRAVTMIHGVIAIFVVLMGCWGLKKIINQDYSKADLFNGLKLSTGLLGGLLVLFIILGGAFRDFQKEPARVNGEIAGPTSDQRFLSVLQQVTNNQQMAQEIYDSFIEDRARVFRVDSIRSLAFILLAAAVVWGFYKNKLK